MKIQTNLKIVAGLVMGLAVIPSVQATEVVVPASVIVNNTVEVTTVRPLSFGTVSALFDGAAALQAAYVMPSDPNVIPETVKTASSAIIELATGSSSEITIANAAPNYPLTVTVAAAVPTLTDPQALTTMQFDLTDFTTYSYLTGNGIDYQFETDAQGALGFYVGATLTTSKVGDDTGGTVINTPYKEGNYTGEFQVNVNY